MSEAHPAPVDVPVQRLVLLRRGLRLAGTRLIEWVYPPTCIGCGAATGTPHGLCPACWQGMAFIERPFCERLGTPFAYEIGGPLLSPGAIADPPVFGRARAAVRYDGTARALVHKLKFGDRMELAEALGTMMVRAGAEVLTDANVLVPVPLHRVRLWQRRFNQSMTLAVVVGRKAGLPVDHGLLARVKRTRQQVGLTRPQRAENLQGAFSVPPERRAEVKGRRVVLVDDVITTGATGNAAARALLRAGAASVDLVAFARVVATP